MKPNTFMVWPENPGWSFQATRIIGLIDYGAANFAECYEVFRRVTPPDEEGWYREWVALGERVEKLGEKCEQAGNVVSARKAYQRACNYYRMAQLFLNGEDERKVPTLHRVKSTFQKACRLMDNPPEQVRIHFEGDYLDGWLARPLGVEKPPVIIYLNGSDSLSEEVYFTAASEAMDRGYAILMYDTPGVGLALFEKGLSARPDSETFVGAAIDYLESRDDIDHSRIVLMGESFAGYLVPRAAAFEKRVRAAVVWTVTYEYDIPHRWKFRTEGLRRHLLHFFGASDYDDLLIKARQFDLTGIGSKITCPLYLLVGDEDLINPRAVSQAIRLYDEAINAMPRKLEVLEVDHGLGGITHCQKDNLHVAHALTFNWLNEVLGD